MKKIINRKVYDTDTAQKIGAWSNLERAGDLTYNCEILYRKRSREFFLHCEGGSMSKYSQYVGNNRWIGAEMIIPLTYDEAMAWAEEHLSADAYEAAFGKIVEDNTKTVTTISLSASALEKARRAAAKEGTPISTYIESLITAQKE